MYIGTLRYKQTCVQKYKWPTIVNYDSRVVLNVKLPLYNISRNLLLQAI